jgi:bifunctional DNA-binding transcriptional regulator/antitoxin component of YhaV-PrlF toxin-antitoxin module
VTVAFRRLPEVRTPAQLAKSLKEFDNVPYLLYILNMVKTTISSKGQTTIPSLFRKKWKTSQVLWDLNPDGTARVSPTPDIMSLLGSAADGKPCHPDEKKKARYEIGRNVAQEGRGK